jgi:hypothetical protein
VILGVGLLGYFVETVAAAVAVAGAPNVRCTTLNNCGAWVWYAAVKRVVAVLAMCAPTLVPAVAAAGPAVAVADADVDVPNQRLHCRGCRKHTQRRKATKKHEIR